MPRATLLKQAGERRIENLEGFLGVIEVGRRVLGQLVDTKALTMTVSVDEDMSCP